MINLDKTPNHAQCFLSKEDESWVWHRRIAHINMEPLLSKGFFLRFSNWLAKTQILKG